MQNIKEETKEKIKKETNSTERRRIKHPYHNHNFLGKILFNWVSPLIKLGNEK